MKFYLLFGIIEIPKEKIKLYGGEDDLNITVGTISDDVRVLNKSFTPSIESLPCDIYNPMSIINPHFILDYNSSILQCNYLYCEEFGRYYFINNVSFESAHRMVLNCHVDVLYTYSSEINNLDALIIRQEELKNYRIADPEVNFETDFQYYIRKFQYQPFADVPQSNYRYVLQTMGGENTYIDANYELVESQPWNWSFAWRTYYVINNNEMVILYSLYPTTVAAMDFNTLSQTYGGIYRKIS